MKTVNPKRVTKLPKAAAHSLEHARTSVFERFPLLFTMLGTFGVVATFYGFEGLIDNIDVLANNPLILLGVGLITLLLSGTLYKKLG